MLSRYLNCIYKEMYDKGFAPIKDNANPEFQEDFDKINDSLRRIASKNKSITRLEEKIGVSIEQIKKEGVQYNTGRRSTSF